VVARAVAFADAAVIKLVKDNFVPVTGDDWYRRRSKDAEGEFFRSVAAQGPRKNSGTKQGVYCLTAAGKFLAYRPGDVSAALMQDLLRRGLAEWNQLPDNERTPGAVQVGDQGKPDQRYNPSPPPGGLVLNVYTRILDADSKSGFSKGTCKFPGGDLAARDHLWLTAADCKALLPAEPKEGDKFPLPARLAERIARFHLVDNTRGEAAMWEAGHIRSLELMVAVVAVTPMAVRLRLEGSAVLATKADIGRAESGFDAKLLGYLNYNRDRKAFDRFDVLALGDHWGKGPFTSARPGRTPLGVVFELSGGAAPADRVPPQGARDFRDYLPGN
jgi:hypothetical protein